MATIDNDIKNKIQKAISIISPYCNIVRTYLFGSHANKTTHPWSDIDLAVFAEGIESWELEKRVRMAALVQKEAGDVVDVHFFPAYALTKHDAAGFAAWVIQHGIEVK